VFAFVNRSDGFLAKASP